MRRAAPGTALEIVAEHLRLPLAAFLVLAGEVLALRVVWTGTFGPEPFIPEAADLALGHAVLICFGLAGAVISLTGVYRFVRRGRALAALVAVPLLFLPAAVASIGSLYASLVLAAIL